MSTRWKGAPHAPYSQGMTHPTVGGLYRMPHPRPSRPCRAPRRVVLESVSRRDAAQRLSLAFTLLARVQAEQAAAPIAADAADRPSGTPVDGSPREEARR
jgi:hypothetical protein